MPPSAGRAAANVARSGGTSTRWLPPASAVLPISTERISGPALASQGGGNDLAKHLDTNLYTVKIMLYFRTVRVKTVFAAPSLGAA